MGARFSIIAIVLIALASLAQAGEKKVGLPGPEWITEAEMKKQSAFARKNNLLLVNLNCKFREDVSNPGRPDVLFRAEFELVRQPTAWGWTFDANVPQEGPEKQAQQAGFEMAQENYFEISGVTWVRCKVWHRP